MVGIKEVRALPHATVLAKLVAVAAVAFGARRDVVTLQGQGSQGAALNKHAIRARVRPYGRIPVAPQREGERA